MKINDLRKIIKDLNDDVEIAFAFNGITESGEILAVTEMHVISKHDLLDYGEESPSSNSNPNVLYLFLNRKDSIKGEIHGF